jgi:hypothetical protein
MENKTYNGWTNYATWRVALELVDNGYYSEEYRDLEASDLADVIEENIKEFIEQGNEGASSGYVLDFAMSFLSDVNWYEIAEHVLDI